MCCFRQQYYHLYNVEKLYLLYRLMKNVFFECLKVIFTPLSAIFKCPVMKNTHSKMPGECVFTTNECALMKNTHSKMPDESVFTTNECVFTTNECALMKNTHSKMPEECAFFTI